MASFQFNFSLEGTQDVNVAAKPPTHKDEEVKQPLKVRSQILAFRLDPDLHKPMYTSILSSSVRALQALISDDCSIEYFALDELQKLISIESDNEDFLRLFSLTEANNSDLVPGLYEGGFKVWECTFDLLNFLKTAEVDFRGYRVLDLGCGAGLLGINALLSEATSVHFHDYNHEVLSFVTIPNLLINLKSNSSCSDIYHTVSNRCSFYCGDWSDFHSLVEQQDHTYYDLILTSETIYSAQSMKKLLEVFQRFLSPNGAVFVAAKSHYFGVGGSTLLFTQLVMESQLFNYELVYEVGSGLPRQIIKLTWRQ